MDFFDELIPIAKTVFEAILASTTFSLLVGFLGLYCLVLFVDIVLLFVLRPLGGDLKKGLFGTKERPLASARSLNREWSSIEARISRRASSEWKLAVLEADVFVDRMLSEMGYEGKDCGERLEAIPSEHFSELGNLREAHAVRNRIIFEKEYSLDQSEATRVIALYRAFLEEIEVLS